MVYGGKPSTGCFLCRKRKIKCDEAFPECRNCLIYGKPCPGYRQDAIFRNETEKIQRLVKRSNSSRSPSTRASPGSNSSNSSPTTTPTEQSSPVSQTSQSAFSSGDSSSFNQPLPLTQLADSTWEDRAVCYFFDQYTSFGEAGEGDCMNHLQYLPSLYAQCRDDASSCLRWAVDATALITLGNEAKVPSLAIKARKSYGMALQGLRQALQSRSQAIQDETFAAVVLLSLFEDITGERNGLSSSHTAGFELLMKLRGESQLGHQLGRDLFSFAYAHTHIEILALGDKPRFNTEWITGLLSSSDPVHKLIVTASKLSELFLKASSTPPAMETDYAAKFASWIESCKLLDFELAQWSHNVPDYWLPLVVHSQQGESLITYRRIAMAAIWNYYRAVRIVLQRLVLELHRTLATFIGASDDAFHHDPVAVNVIHEMITDICRSIPFSLGDVDSGGNPVRSVEGKPQIRAFHGYTLLWPLWYVLSCGLATPEQTQQIRSVLSRVGSALGIKLALILAEAPEGQYPGAGRPHLMHMMRHSL